MLQFILEPILVILFFGTGYVLGFFPVWLGSLGAIEPGPIDKIQDNAYYRSEGMKWWHLTYTSEGSRYLPAEAVALVGWLVVATIVGLAWALLKIAG